MIGDSNRRFLSSPLNLAIGAALACVLGALALIRVYGSENFFTEFVAGLGAALLAFMIALAWEREREQRKLDQQADEVVGLRETEAKRRLQSVQDELGHNRDSLELLEAAFKRTDPEVTTILHPQLLEGAWAANGARLTELLGLYDLSSRLATFYGRTEELRWRIRYRTEHRDTTLDRMTARLVMEMLDQVKDLYTRVGEQIAAPDVKVFGVIHRRVLGIAYDMPGSADMTVVPGPGEGSSPDSPQ